MSVNFEGALTLLKVADLAKQWPGLQGLHDAAMSELGQAAAQCVADRKAAEEKKAQEAQRAAAAKAPEEAPAEPAPEAQAVDRRSE